MSDQQFWLEIIKIGLLSCILIQLAYNGNKGA